MGGWGWIRKDPRTSIEKIQDNLDAGRVKVFYSNLCPTWRGEYYPIINVYATWIHKNKYTLTEKELADILTKFAYDCRRLK